MVRIFVKNRLEPDTSFVPPEEECHYLLQVLRMRSGEELDVVDVDGAVYNCVIGTADKKTVSVDVLKMQKGSHEMKTKITLYQSVSKGERMDLTIQKSVELGVNKIVPVISDRCVVKLDGKSSKSDRWQKIALEAARQSGRCTRETEGSTSLSACQNKCAETSIRFEHFLYLCRRSMIRRQRRGPRGPPHHSRECDIFPCHPSRKSKLPRAPIRSVAKMVSVGLL